MYHISISPGVREKGFKDKYIKICMAIDSFIPMLFIFIILFVVLGSMNKKRKHRTSKLQTWIEVWGQPQTLNLDTPKFKPMTSRYNAVSALLFFLLLIGSFLVYTATQSFFLLGTGVLFAIIIAAAVVIAKEWERGVVLRLGKYKALRGPGFFLIIPVIDQVIILDTRTQVMDVKPQEIMSADSSPVEVDAVVFYKIVDPKKAVLNVEDYEDAAVKMAQTTLRDIVGKSTLDELLKKKEKIGDYVKKILDKNTDPWGIQVEHVEIRDVILPQMLKRAMAKEAEAVREKVARIIKSSAELEASEKFAKAAKIMGKFHGALQLRQLQTWQEIGAEQNSLMILIPSDFSDFGKGAMGLGVEWLHRLPKKKKK